MNALDSFKDCVYIDKIFTKKNALILLGVAAEVSLIALLILSEIPVAAVATTLVATNLIKLVLIARKIKKKDEDISLIIKKKQDVEREVTNLKQEIVDLKRKLTI